ncbi:MAG: type II secretion system F family protein [Candidatus Omnitrophica bacterium]|nr:type II secretion system F family protein [Candidatus Omnitrophota bacterium]MDD5236182.1 type II secretion system F family protein [Candidatus Omnitrophota bacterium]MDD5610831.1 type II secretion system F family protein [Candidatus Omnitrophota bacterium]
MELFVFAAVFFVIFFSVYTLLKRRQAKYSGLEMRQLMPQAKPSELSVKSERKEGFKGILAFLSPLAQKVAAKKPREGLVRDLVTAGKPLTIVEFYALVLLCTIIGLVAGVIFMNVTSGKNPNLAIPLFGAFFGFAMPRMWLNQKKKKRQQSIAKELPSVIDLLNLCVGSGIDFMLAVNRVIKDYKPCPLTDELTQLWQENNMGTPRKDALRNLSWRVNLPEMSSFVSTLIQADKMGTPISDALEIQAEQIRIKRFQRGEEQALQAPIKLLIPLIFFILPVVAIIVAAPILIQFLQGGINF